MFDRVVVGMDGRPAQRDALALARLLAPTAELVLFRAFTYSTSGLVAGLLRWDDVVRGAIEEALERERDAAGVQARIEAVADTAPPLALQDAARRHDADLLVLGSARHGRIGRVLLGDSARVVVQHAPCPVAVAPSGHVPSGLARVVVGIDGSDEAARALALAAGLARTSGASLRVLVAVRQPLVLAPAYPWVDDTAEHLARQHAIAGRLAADAVARAHASPVSVEAEVMDGEPGLLLEEASEDADLVVVGSRTWGALRRTVLGSTSDRLMHHAHCPVLVVPRRDTP